jgi:Fe2+ transport system protein FeoA
MPLTKRSKIIFVPLNGGVLRRRRKGQILSPLDSILQSLGIEPNEQFTLFEGAPEHKPPVPRSDSQSYWLRRRDSKLAALRRPLKGQRSLFDDGEVK